MSVNQEMLDVAMCGFCIEHGKSFTTRKNKAASKTQGLDDPVDW